MPLYLISRLTPGSKKKTEYPHYAIVCSFPLINKKEGKPAILKRVMRKRTNSSKAGRWETRSNKRKRTRNRKTKEKQHRKRNEGKNISIPELRNLVTRYFSECTCHCTAVRYYVLSTLY
jgi:hypothetical protein